jgi:hypothetical protein
MQAGTGNVDEDIDAAVIRDDFLKSVLHVGFPCHIESHEHRLFAASLDFGCELVSPFLIYVQNHHSEVVPNQTFNYSLSYP